MTNPSDKRHLPLLAKLSAVCVVIAAGLYPLSAAPFMPLWLHVGTLIVLPAVALYGSCLAMIFLYRRVSEGDRALLLASAATAILLCGSIFVSVVSQNQYISVFRGTKISGQR